MKDVRKMLNDFSKGMKDLSATHGKNVGAFMNFVQVSEADGHLSEKTKELMSVAISVFAHCEYCIAYHVNAAYKAGATREEIIEAGMVSVTFGGGPSIAYSATVLMDAVNEFENDYKK